MLARSSLLVVAAIGFVALAGCGGGGSSTVPHHVTLPAQTIYVTSAANSGTILEFPASANGNVAATTTISGTNTTLFDPVPMALDSTGAIYTSNEMSPAVLEFAPGSSGNVAPEANGGLNGVQTKLSEYCFGVALDAANKIYVTSESSTGTTPSVAVFTAATGNPSPVQFIQGAATTLTYPVGVAVDSSDNIYVTQAQSGTILKFAAGAGAGTNYNVAPTATIVTPGTNLFGIAISAAGQIYVDDAGGNAVYVYSAGATPTLLGTIHGAATGINYPLGIAVDRNSNVYVANHQGGDGTGSITVYAAGAYGNIPPTATITDTGNLVNPFGIAVH
jgi:serine/threonine-protein kinase